MYNHEPPNYRCPFCMIAKGTEEALVHTMQDDIFYHDEFITAFIASHWWPNNKGHVIIIPNDHIENIYDLPDDLSDKIHHLEKKIAIALKEVYLCDGVSSRQHNGPYGNQDVWHFHLHVFPRYKEDELYLLNDEKYLSAPENRTPFAAGLREYFKKI